MENIVQGTNVLFILLGAIMVFAMHAGFAFLEVGTVRHKNQVNALAKILTEFCVSTIAYYFICLLYTSPSPRDGLLSRMPSSA